MGTAGATGVSALDHPASATNRGFHAGPSRQHTRLGAQGYKKLQADVVYHGWERRPMLHAITEDPGGVPAKLTKGKEGDV